MQAVADLASEHLGLSQKPIVKLKDVRAGRYHCQYVTIPEWISEYGESYEIYYIVHEICHSIVLNHGPVFKQIETKLLAMWGIVPTYAKAYVRALHSTFGQPLFVRPWKTGKRVLTT